MPFSHSQLETFESCPLKYRLRYIERIRTERKSVEAFRGTLVHATLEKLYRDLRMSRLPSLEDLEAHYLQAWEASFGPEVFVVSGEYGPEDYLLSGLRCIRNYYRRHYPFASGTAVWLEKKVHIPLRDASGRRIGFTGILDRLDGLGEGRYEIHDYKTSSSLPSWQELEGDRQLSLYQLAVEEAFPDARDVDLVWHYLVFDRELRLRRKREDLERVAAEAVELVARIEAADDFPARESALCEWCEVQEHCPRRKHLFMVAKIPARELGTDRGIQLVDQFAEWNKKKEEAEEHLRELRQEVLDFSAYQGVDNLQGSGHVLGIARGRRIKPPPAGSPQRAELEELFKREGIWEKVSDLSPGKLASALEKGSMGGELLKRLDDLVVWEETQYLRLRDA